MIEVLVILAALAWLLGAFEQAAPMLELPEFETRIGIENSCPWVKCDELDQSVVIEKRGEPVRQVSIGYSRNHLRIQVYRIETGTLVFVGTGGSVRVDPRTSNADEPCIATTGRDCASARIADYVTNMLLASPTSARPGRVYLGAFDHLRPEASNGRKGFGFFPAAHSPEQNMAELGRLSGG